jgi:uncharacterized membrane protein YbaN (DUF454 family)
MASLDKNDPTRPVETRGSDVASHGPDVELDEKAGSIRVRDPRLIHTGRRGFCRRLIEAAARRPGVRKAEIDLASASCRLEFGSGPATSQAMAEAFANSVREAASADPHADRIRMWRPSAGWSALSAYPLNGEVSFWEIVEVKPGRMRLLHRMRAGHEPVPLSRLAIALSGFEGVEACYVRLWSHRMTIDFRRESPVAGRFLDDVERTFEELMAAGTSRRGSPARALSVVDGGATEVATGLKRLKYLGLAGGAFAMTLAALVVPGLPTVPFLLATSYYLARSSPRLDALLRRTAYFGPILTEWEQYHRLSRSSKGKLIGLTVAIIVVTVVLIPLSPVALVVILLLMSVSILGVIRMPALAEEPPAEIPHERPARLVLPEFS